MYGGTVLGVERGDLLFPLQDRARAWVVLARPDFGVSTRDAYGWWDEAYRRERGAADPRTLRGEWVNDLEPPVAARHPRVAHLVRKLKREGAQFAAMSGSGSAVFGTFATRSAAQAAAHTIGDRRTATWVTRTTNYREYQRDGKPTRA
jgi:4-diphosphocytidyl-2-C-methyl-D-erythritol kinase